jgi:hypothetical protein
MEHLKELKYYNLSWSDSSAHWGGLIGRYATKQQAQTELRKCKKENPSYDYEIKEISIVELIEHEKEKAVLDSKIEMRLELEKFYYKKYQTELEQAIKREKKRLQKEMRNIVKNWFEINPDGN